MEFTTGAWVPVAISGCPPASFLFEAAVAYDGADFWLGLVLLLGAAVLDAAELIRLVLGRLLLRLEDVYRNQAKRSCA